MFIMALVVMFLISFKYMNGTYLKLVTKSRSIPPKLYCEKGVPAAYYKIHYNTTVSCEFSEIFKNTFFNRTPLMAASEKSMIKTIIKVFRVHKRCQFLLFLLFQ